MRDTIYAVYIATTQGPVRIQHIDYEDEGVLSHIGVEGSTRPEPITRDYRHFVDRSSGLVARRVGHDAFRVSLSAGIEQGSSWQAGMLLAHILKDQDKLAEGEDLDDATAILWLTGEVRAKERLAAVQEVERKFDRSDALFAQAANRNLPVYCFCPKDNRNAIPALLPDHVKADALDMIKDIETQLTKREANQQSAATATQSAITTITPSSIGADHSGRLRPLMARIAPAAALLLLAGIAFAWLYQTEPELFSRGELQPLPTPPHSSQQTGNSDIPLPRPPKGEDPAIEDTADSVNLTDIENPAPAPLPDEQSVENVDPTPESPTSTEPVVAPPPVEEPPAAEPPITTPPIVPPSDIEDPVITEEPVTVEAPIIDAPVPPKPLPKPKPVPADPAAAMPLVSGQLWYLDQPGTKCRKDYMRPEPLIQQDERRFKPAPLVDLCGIRINFGKPAKGFSFHAAAFTGPRLINLASFTSDDKGEMRIRAPKKRHKNRRYILVMLTSPTDKAAAGHAFLESYIEDIQTSDKRPNWMILAQRLARQGHHLSVVSQRLLVSSSDF